MTGQRNTFPPAPVCQTLCSSAVSAVPGWQEPGEQGLSQCLCPALQCPLPPASHLWGHTEPGRETTGLKKKNRKNLTSTSAEIAPKYLTTDPTALPKQQNKKPSHAKQSKKTSKHLLTGISWKKINSR